jgi:hypothetical protein
MEARVHVESHSPNPPVTQALATPDAGKDGPGMSSHAQIFEGNSLVRKGKLAGALHRYRRALESVQGLGIQGTLPSMCRENIKHIEKARWETIFSRCSPDLRRQNYHLTLDVLCTPAGQASSRVCLTLGVASDI